MKIKLFYTAGKETTKRAKLHPRHNDVAGGDGDGDGNHGDGGAGDYPGNGWNKCVFLLFTVHHAGIGVGVDGIDGGDGDHGGDCGAPAEQEATDGTKVHLRCICITQFSVRH